MNPAIPISDRFWLHVKKSKGCWIWTGAKRDGYGRIGGGPGKNALQAHRVSWELEYGPIPEGKCVLHRCDNPPCVRPRHLFLGTKFENAVDRDRKGRRKTGRIYPGSQCKTSKLIEKQVLRLRRLRTQGWTLIQLAIEFDIHYTHVRRICLRKNWRHI